MLSVIGSLIGFASSTAPAIADHFKQKSNQRFELERMKYAAELRKDGYDFELKAHEAQASDKEHERLIQHDISINRGEDYICLTTLSAPRNYILLLWSVLSDRNNFAERSIKQWDGRRRVIANTVGRRHQGYIRRNN